MSRGATESRLSKLLASPPSGGVIFLHGEEEHLREQALTQIVAALCEPATRDFNLDQLRGNDVTAEALASMVATPPMMADRRVIIVRDGQGLSPKAREVVEATTPAPPPGLFLIIVAQIPAGSSARFYNNLKQKALAFEFAPIDALDLPGWLTERAAEHHGLTLELDAARALLSGVGGKLGILASELEKLEAFVDGRNRITLHDVEAVGGHIARPDRWGWFEQVADRRFSEALAALPDLLSLGENGVGLLIGVGAQLVRIGLVTAGGRDALDRELKGYQRWLANRVVTSARLWTTEEVDLAMGELLRTDRLLKSASLTDRQALEELLLRLAERLEKRQSAA